MYKYLLIFVLTFFTGCFSNKNLSVDVEKKDERNSTKRVYKDISKDAIFEAAKRTFILTGGLEFRIDSYRDSIIVSKTKLSHYPFYTNVSEDRWQISIEEKDNSSYVKVLAKRINNFDDKNPIYLSSSLHELLFDRIDFYLGLKDNWSSCLVDFSLDDALCDIIDLKFYSNPTKEDVLKNIYISQRKPSKKLIDTKDILLDDISFSVDEQSEDILSQEDNIDTSSETREFDAEILELDKKINRNLDKTLDKIDDSLEDKEEANESNK
ncbi:hypothetical protein CRV01_06170 [Arcobacter sp. CECT 8983]|uniref:hypothetical protein n=1 Tax=Arcobacter sp. CECT 8983 TaxID=2044508 RepID=UPI00100BB191|nr:hypothetical protein [Arcobacter sp. CECT 8983]RXJ90732.1 hypothetical protein CRV01_06170 [Arcobacter sp. CECT 8983]